MNQAALLKNFRRELVIILIISFLTWATSFSVWVNQAEAAKLTSVSDTLSDSDTSVLANHTIGFTLRSAVTASSTMVIDFPDSFQSTSTPAFASSDPLDFDIASSTTELSLYAAGGCPGSGATAGFEITSITSANVFTFTHCNGTADVAASASMTMEIGANATTGGAGDSQLRNPPATGSYEITITAPAADSGKTRVFIIDDVTVTAAVSTSFTFTVTGVASGAANANDGGTTGITTTATTIPWGTLTVGTSSTARQDLTVATNAKNGFTVTVWQDQNLTSVDGADIDNFQQSATSTPVAWSAPANTIDDENTFGHQGITSEDSSLSGGDTYSTALFSGIGSQSSAVEIFYHDRPANGTTANKGATKIGFKIEIASMQEAGEDYTQTLTYIATPVF